MELTRCLQEVGRNDFALAGGKAVNLGVLTRAGLSVPEGFVILTTAYQALLMGTEMQPQIEELAQRVELAVPASIEEASRAIRALFEQAAMPGEVANAIRTMYTRFGCGAVAVRSSATAEDLPDASFAGQQESYLNVQGIEQVLAAVKRCWSSLWTERAIAYRARQCIKSDGLSLAVVVQRMVPADVSGILFTANPVTGARDEIVINAAWGLGEAIVGGRVNPDTIVVDKASGEVKHMQVADKAVMTALTADGTTDVPVDSQKRARPVLSTEQIAELARSGREIEAVFDRPQDIEWAIADEKIAILQARPVTALQAVATASTPQTATPIAPGDDSWDREYEKPAQPFDLWTRTNFGENLPYPITPFTSTGFPALMGQNQDPAQEGPQIARRFYGRLYMNEGAVMHMLSEEYGLPSSVIDSMWGSRRRGKHTMQGRFRPWRLIRRMPSLLRMLWRQMRKRGPKQTPQQFFAQIDAWVNDFTRRDLSALDDRALWAEGLPVWKERGAYVFSKNIAISLPAAMMFGTLERLVGWWTKQKEMTHDLVMGMTGVYSAEVGPLLWQMAQTLRNAGLAEIILEHPGLEALVLLRQRPEAQGFIEQFEAFLQRHGHRCPNEVEFLNPRWAEAPEQVIELLRGYLRAGSTINPGEAENRQRQRREDAVAMVEKKIGPVRRRIFRSVLAKAQNAVRLRDNSRFYVTKFFFPTRKLLAQFGQRWAGRGWLKQEEDIFFLTVSELEKLAAEGDPMALGRDLHSLVADRRLAHEYWFTVVAPEVIGPDGRPVFDEEEERTTLDGIAVSGGQARGIARIVLDPRAAAQLHPGEILVTQATDPGWTPVFPLVSGLVLEIGGQLSHGAIVAREYGIPAVLNVQGAMRRIRDGQIITVDGTAGKVHLHEV